MIEGAKLDLSRFEAPFAVGLDRGRFDLLELKTKEFAYFLDKCLPESREKSIAMTELENVFLRSITCVARNSQTKPR